MRGSSFVGFARGAGQDEVRENDRQRGERHRDRNQGTGTLVERHAHRDHLALVVYHK